jgi:hypothetical protein
MALFAIGSNYGLQRSIAGEIGIHLSVFWHILFRRRIEKRLLQTGASLVQQGITKSQHQAIWWLPFTHEGCLGLGL